MRKRRRQCAGFLNTTNSCASKSAVELFGICRLARGLFDRRRLRPRLTLRRKHRHHKHHDRPGPMSVTTRQSASEPAPDEPSVSLLVAAILGQAFHPDLHLVPMSFVDLIACHAKVLAYRSDVFESLCFDQIAMVDDPVYDQARAHWAMPDLRARDCRGARAMPTGCLGVGGDSASGSASTRS